jgi:hypothetical protein
MNFKSALTNGILSSTLFCVGAQAGTIDFTSSTWSGSNNLQTFFSGGVTLSASALTLFGVNPSPVLTFNSPGACGSNPGGLACTGNGIGIDRQSTNPAYILDTNSQIDFAETLRVRFASAVDILRLDFLNANTVETMLISVNGGVYAPFVQLASNPDGYFPTSFSAAGVNYIDIQGLLGNASLARIEVPVPGSSALLGLGLLGLLGVHRKKQA